MGATRTVIVIVVVLVGGLLIWRYWPGTPATPPQMTKMQLESYGGFAYVYTPTKSMLEIAYLNDSGSECIPQLDQLGTDLMVISGDILEPTNAPPTRMFDLDGAVVTFPDLEQAPGQLSVNRSPRVAAPPFRPNDMEHWKNLQWVAGVSSGAPGTDFPARTLHPNWPALPAVNGRVVVTRGKVEAGHPSDWTLQHAVFDFNATDSAGVSTTKFTQALTDRVVITADVPSDKVVIKLQHATSGISQIVVKPTNPGRPVKLKLMGRHAHGTAALAVGERIDHFCAFYALMDQPIAQTDQLIPVVKHIDAPVRAGEGQPSPGALCPGDWP